MTQQGLDQRVPAKQWLSVVERIGGLHAQLMSAAELALWARVEDLPADTVSTALWQERTLVKTWALRGTLHLLPATEFALTMTVLHEGLGKFYQRKSWFKYFKVTPEEMHALTEAIRTTLTDQGLTREQLAATIAQQLNAPHLEEQLRSGWGSLLKPIAHKGYLCFGPNQGQNVTFVQPEHWLGKQAPIDPEQAMLEVARRYLAVYGPGTPEEFGRWWGIDDSQAKKLFRTLQTELVPVAVENWSALALSSTVQAIQASAPNGIVRLLPYFDFYTIAVAPHSDYLLAAANRARVYRSQGWISPAVVVDGRIVGVWEHEQKRTRILVKVDLFEPMTTHVKSGIEAEVERLANYLGGQAELQIESAA